MKLQVHVRSNGGLAVSGREVPHEPRPLIRLGSAYAAQPFGLGGVESELAKSLGAVPLKTLMNCFTGQ